MLLNNSGVTHIRVDEQHLLACLGKLARQLDGYSGLSLVREAACYRNELDISAAELNIRQERLIRLLGSKITAEAKPGKFYLLYLHFVPPAYSLLILGITPRTVSPRYFSTSSAVLILSSK